MTPKVRILTIRFKNPIYKDEIALLRGAVIQAMNNQADILFHNHIGEQLRYSYPLIQYKRINRCAAIVCVNEGVDVVGQLFSSGSTVFQLGKRELQMEVDKIRALQYTIQLWGTLFTYQLRQWLPLNQENYIHYMELESLAQRSAFLEKILVGNLLSFAKGIHVFLEKEIKCSIIQMEEQYPVYYKGVKLLSFDVVFKSNLSLPDFVGIGKNASINCGTVTRIYHKKEEEPFVSENNAEYGK